MNVAYLSETAYTSTLSHEFNMAEPEDAMKWEALRPKRDVFDFAGADQIVDFARTNHMKVRGHNLAWGTHNPSWLTQGQYGPEQLAHLLKQHIQTVVEHFRGRVFAWDVVNEAFDEKGGLRHSIWYDQPGIGKANMSTAYIEDAFRYAHAADPHALLFYNDAEGEALNRKSDAIYAMVKDFKKRGVPIDGVGLQMHILDLDPNIASIAQNIARFAKLGVQVQLTELDVALPVDAQGQPLNPQDLKRQAEIYREVAAACLKETRCTAIQTWGITDKYSWIGWYTHRTKGAGLLFDRMYAPKPAYFALKQALTERPGWGGPITNGPPAGR